MPESALLAGLPKAPTTYSPFERAEAAKRRRGIVLARMVDVGALPGEEAKRAAAATLDLVPPERRRTTEPVLPGVRPAAPGAAVRRRHRLQGRPAGLHDAVAGHAAQGRAVGARGAARARGPADQGRRPRHRSARGSGRSPGGRAARDRAPDRLHQGDGRRLRLLQERVQPRGPGAPPARLGVQAVRVHRRARGGVHAGEPGRRRPGRYQAGQSGKAWKPDNYDRKFRGPITLQQALEESVNIGAVKIQERVGIRRTIDVARRTGVESPLRENLSLALGTSDLTLLELTSAYGALANQGTWTRPVGDPLRARRAGQAPRGERPRGPSRCSRPRWPTWPRTCCGAPSSGGPARRPRRSAARPRRRREPPTTTRTPGSSATRRSSRPASGWATIARAASASDETGSRVAVPIWTSFMTSALAGMPAEDFAIPGERGAGARGPGRERDLCPAGDDGLRGGDRAAHGVRARPGLGDTSCGAGRPRAGNGSRDPGHAGPTGSGAGPGRAGLAGAPAAALTGARRSGVPIALPPRPQAMPVAPTAPLRPAPSPAVRGTQSP